MSNRAQILFARLFDICMACIALVVSGPLVLISFFLVWLQDRHSPLYLSQRMGRGGVPFRMLKVRTMSINADKKLVDSTSVNDPRITKVGAWIRRFKIDEMPQFLNVIVGQMALVGPRPNVARETALYTEAEKKLLTVKPGVTDLASIIFFDLGHILESAPDANIAYNQLVRPWKSRLGLLYIQKRTLWVDLAIVALTALSFLRRRDALALSNRLIGKLGGDPLLLKVCARKEPLFPYPPPGSDKIVQSREPSRVPESRSSLFSLSDCPAP
jgi:lipopolysaccharide/colanic/teichoic acid biosynthesis glycosyltransferase